MASSKEIEAPHVLASLPRPIDAENGRSFAACVSSLGGAKKRKRSEVAVAVDGEGISIYNVQNPRLVTSYALPPHTYFFVPACSIYCKANQQRPAKRFSYAAVSQSPNGAKPQLLGFAEDIQPNATSTPQKFSHDLNPSSKKVTFIDTIPVKGTGLAVDELHDVVVVHEDGQVECLSADLQQLRWQIRLEDIISSSGGASGSAGVTTEFVALTNAETARRGILKSRDDVVAMLDPSLEQHSELLESTQLLCVVTRAAQGSSQERTLHLLALRPRSPDIISTQRAAAQHLLSNPLPAPEATPSEPESPPSYSLHASSGTLYLLTSGVITCYDLSGMVPRISARLESAESPIRSFSRLSSTSVLAASKDFCALYDVKYSTLQDILPLSAGSETAASPKKRKASGGGAQLQEISMVNYFSEIGLAVGLTSTELIGLQIGASAAPRRNRAKGTLLIDAIGKGIGNGRNATTELNGAGVAIEASVMKVKRENGESEPLIDGCVSGPACASDSRWQNAIKELDELAKAQDVRGFEARFASEIGVSLSMGEVKRWRKKQEKSKGAGKEINEDNAPLPRYQIEQSFSGSARLVHLPKALYALGKIFAWTPVDRPTSEEDETPIISVEFFPPNVIQWLVEGGYLTKDLIEKALRQSSPYIYRARSVKGGDIVNALVDYDPEMRILYAILNQDDYLDVTEVVQAIKLIVQSLDNKPLPQLDSHLLLDGETDRAADVPEDTDKQVESEVAAASEDIERALSTLEDGLLIRSQTLRPALTRLYAFPKPLITSALRSKLNQHQLTFLIHLLRIELAEGGWASRYFETAAPLHPPASAEIESPSDQAITIIASLLSCCVDAIGLAGWFNKAGPAADELIQSLRREISAALEGIHEATFMQGLLAEFLRYGHRARHAPAAPTARQLARRGKPADLHQLQLLQHRDDPVSAVAALERHMLPLGLAVERGVDEVKVGLGGEVRRKSKREVGMEISMRVPKYSVERIRV